MQGRLRNETVTVDVETTCQHCGCDMHMTLDSDMQISGLDSGADPLVFAPDVDWSRFTGRTIIDSY